MTILSSPSGLHHCWLPRWLSGKESAANAEDSGDVDSISGSGRSPGEGNGNPHQYPCLGNPMDRGTRWTAIHGVAKIRTLWYVEPEQPFRDQADKLQKTETETDVNENKEKNRHILGFKVNAEATAAPNFLSYWVYLSCIFYNLQLNK